MATDGLGNFVGTVTVNDCRDLVSFVCCTLHRNAHTKTTSLVTLEQSGRIEPSSIIHLMLVVWAHAAGERAF